MFEAWGIMADHLLGFSVGWIMAWILAPFLLVYGRRAKGLRSKIRRPRGVNPKLEHLLWLADRIKKPKRNDYGQRR